ncbi:hypothetical protein LIX17_06815 [Mycobacterium avium subsp. hominissuis]|uniref:hypothetical protein n=1 Tax=Mycobacterium avium TaxID=1764 RepID=UPI00191C823A|nr:hypothetical protein [Mycobacterium avium]
MPETRTAGVDVVVADGFATIDFVDRELRGPALAKLIDIGGPGSVEPLTRKGPRKRYRVPEGNAREAGLLDDSSAVDALASGDTGHAQRLADADPRSDSASDRVGDRPQQRQRTKQTRKDDADNASHSG